MADLKDVQVKTLTEADIYRETGGKSEQDMPNSGPGGPTPSQARAQAMSGGSGHVPGGTPNF